MLALVGTSAGMGAAYWMGAPPPNGAKPGVERADAQGKDTKQGETEFVKLNNQFVIPVIEGDGVDALVVISLSLEAGTGQREWIYRQEPKLRDAFLRVLFDHANMGGFDGRFTKAETLGLLRTALLEVAQMQLGDSVADVLITNLARQDE
ncbi:flagellar basal body-associated FliL family protein [Pukyongiella litopenaei]|nr:flagellar basal body-associated FliL family protein [Pukyongiella litopenaei]